MAVIFREALGEVGGREGGKWQRHSHIEKGSLSGRQVALRMGVRLAASGTWA